MRKFVKSLEEKALGAKVVKGARPDQQLVKIVNDELIALMGGKQAELNVPNDGPQARTFPCFLQNAADDRFCAHRSSLEHWHE